MLVLFCFSSLFSLENTTEICLSDFSVLFVDSEVISWLCHFCVLCATPGVILPVSLLILGSGLLRQSS